MNIGVIAGDPLDTQMGVDFLRERNINAHGYPAAYSAQEQTFIMQMMSVEERTSVIKSIFQKAIKDGSDGFFIYCNSLSAVVDMDTMSHIFGKVVVTPLHVYKNLAKKYKRIMAIAGNNQGMAGIERTICMENPDCYVVGMGCFPIVRAVEESLPPEEIVRKFGFENLMSLYIGADCECLILGCTHFGYFQEALEKVFPAPIINPAEGMLEILLERMERKKN